jgi:hypothetical protein
MAKSKSQEERRRKAARQGWTTTHGRRGLAEPAGAGRRPGRTWPRLVAVWPRVRARAVILGQSCSTTTTMILHRSELNGFGIKKFQKARLGFP